jgi:hypothetical protein
MTLVFVAAGQVVGVEPFARKGWTLLFHPT